MAFAALAASPLHSPPEGVSAYDLGVIELGRGHLHEFWITNSGTAALKITSAASLCDCAELVSFPASVGPGSAEPLRVVAQPQSLGPHDSLFEVQVEGESTSRHFRLLGWADANPTLAWTNLLLNAKELQKQGRRDSGVTFVDVRSADRFRLARIPGSLNLELHTVKTRKFLQAKTLVLLNEGHDDRMLLAEGHQLVEGGFVAVRVLAGGFAAWLQSGGPAEGENVRRWTSTALSSDQYSRVRFQPGWLLVYVGDPTALTSWPKGWPVVTAGPESESLEDAFHAAIAAYPETQRVLVASDRGQGYDDLPALQSNVPVPPRFYLAGGLQALREGQAREAASLGRRQLTIGLHANAGPGAYRGSRAPLRSCCGHRR